MDLRIFASNSNLRQIWCQICPPNKCRKCETNLLSHLSRRNVGQMCFKYAIMFALVQSFFFKTRQMWRVKNGKMPLFLPCFYLRDLVAGSTTADVLSLGATKNYISKALKCTHFYFTTGYSTHMIGKWHLGFCSWSYTPLYRGFDSFYGIYLGAGDHYTHETAGILDLHDNETPVENKDGVYSTYLYAEVWNNNRFLFILFFFFFFV